MRIVALTLLALCCRNAPSVTENSFPSAGHQPPLTQKQFTDSASWQWFLQHLPEGQAPLLDYTGRAVADGDKAYATLAYDVGNRDLQQCADALMRLRAEYLFCRGRYNDISFRFTSGHPYSFNAYCAGSRPVARGNAVSFVHTASVAPTKQALRSYLDVVYTYAGTISLAKELKTATAFEVGTVVITPGSPGHCFIITDECATASDEKLYKLVEGYTPAQTIYVLRNTAEPALGPWHRLNDGEIETASYRFKTYALKKFE